YSLGKAGVANLARLQASFQRAFHVEVLHGSDPISLRGNDGSDSTTSIIQAAMAQREGASQDQALVSSLDQLRRELLRLPEAAQARDNVQTGLARDGVV